MQASYGTTHQEGRAPWEKGRAAVGAALAVSCHAASSALMRACMKRITPRMAVLHACMHTVRLGAAQLLEHRQVNLCFFLMVLEGCMLTLIALAPPSISANMSWNMRMNCVGEGGGRGWMHLSYIPHTLMCSYHLHSFLPPVSARCTLEAARTRNKVGQKQEDGTRSTQS